MRLWETLLLVSVLTSFADTCFIHPDKKNRLWWLGITFFALVMHVLLDGILFQMSFVYLSLILLWIRFSLEKKSQIQNKGLKKTKKRTLVIPAIVFSLLTLALLVLFPINSMPEPSGPYSIGTLTYEISDPDRIEIYGSETDVNRQIKFQLWYPADSEKNGWRTKWIMDGKKATTGIPRMLHIPDFFLYHTALIDSNSYSGLEVSSQEEKYPLIVISHGWTGFMTLHSDLAEMLASHGYIVVSINHTFGAAVTVFDDGEVYYVDPNALPDQNSIDNFGDYSENLVKTFSQDDALVIDFLERTAATSQIDENYSEISQKLAGKIDFDKIGALGHSTGGGGVVELSIEDARIKAVFGMDAWVEPISSNTLSRGLTIPSCFLRSEQWENGPNNDSLKELFTSSAVMPMIFQIDGGVHQDFTMLYMYNPIAKLSGAVGSLDSFENSAIQQDYILTFFDQYLYKKADDVGLLESKYQPVFKVEELYD